MKKFLTLKNILLCAGALCAVIGFFVSFTAGLIARYPDTSEEIVGIILGKPSIINVSPFGTPGIVSDGVHAGLSLAGVILMLIFGLGGAAVGLFLKKPYTKWVVLGCAGVVLLGTIFVFCLNPAYALAEEVDLDDLSDFHLNAGAVFTGIFGLLSAGAIGASAFVKD